MTLVSLAGVAVITGVHLAASMLRRLRFSPRSHVLSAAGGTAVAFVLVQLLPSVAHAQAAIAGGAGLGEGPRGRSLFVATLIGLLGYLAVERSVRVGLAERPYLSRRLFWLNVNTSAALEVTVGYLLAVDRDGAVRVVLFSVAMALRALVTDRGLYQTHPGHFDRYGRPVLLAAVPAGWVLGVLGGLSEVEVAAVRAFLAGGVLLHVLKEELPQDRDSSYPAFIGGALGYAALLLLL